MTPELLELGRQVATDPTCRRMMRGDPPRPLTNLEMFAAAEWIAAQIQSRVERDGCCGGTISPTGRCPETGRPCPLWQAAQRIEHRTFPKEDL